MARDTRKIEGGVRLHAQDGKTRQSFGPDDVDELAAAATPEQLERLVQAGAISGDWGQKAEEPVDTGKPKGKGGK